MRQFSPNTEAFPFCFSSLVAVAHKFCDHYTIICCLLITSLTKVLRIICFFICKNRAWKDLCQFENLFFAVFFAFLAFHFMQKVNKQWLTHFCRFMKNQIFLVSRWVWYCLFLWISCLWSWEYGYLLCSFSIWCKISHGKQVGRSHFLEKPLQKHLTFLRHKCTLVRIKITLSLLYCGTQAHQIDQWFFKAFKRVSWLSFRVSTPFSLLQCVWYF